MSERFETEFSVRSYELDAALDAPPASFLRWFQEAAIRASAAYGYDEERYEQLGTAWFMKESHLLIRSQPRTGELVRVVTWVGDITRVNSHRQYLAFGSDGRMVARGEANWVYVDRKTGRPRRLEREILDAFQQKSEYALEDRDWGAAVLSRTYPADPQFTTTHVVRWTELDAAGHVNNAVYADWIRDDCAAFRPEARIVRLRLNYRQPALLGESLVRELVPLEETVWGYRIRRCESEETISLAVIQTTLSVVPNEECLRDG